MEKALSQTESVCPECLKRIPAALVLHDQDVYLEKTCPQHGNFTSVVWRGQPEYQYWLRPKIPSFPQKPSTEVVEGCPYDCGLCSDHRQHTCSVLFEVTERCDLHCPVCFADSGSDGGSDCLLPDIAAWYERLLTLGGPYNIQLSGGEPCVRDDLPEIIRIGRSYGFSYFQLNTNGLRLAHDPDYLAELKSAGLSTVFLQFDGTTDSIYRQIRGRDLLDQKMSAIAHCAEQDIGLVLVPTLVPGINTDDIGSIIRLGLAHMPAVRGVHFQPISYFGRYPQSPGAKLRITIPEVIQAIDQQTNGWIRADTFCPSGCENAICSFHGSYVLMADGQLKNLTHHKTNSCCQPAEAALGAARSREFIAENWSAPASRADIFISSRPGLGEWDSFIERKRTYTFCISGMAFQDAWTLDLERLRGCCIHVASPDGRLIPFCAYNLTDRQGRSLYRNKANENNSA